MIKLNKEFLIPEMETKGKQTFLNPMGKEPHPDPCIVYCAEEKCYYGISTTGIPLWGNDTLTIHRSEKFEDMFVKSESRVAYKSNEEDDTYGYLWAPEMHYIRGKWYIYTSCQNGPDSDLKHVIVLETKTDSPFDGFKISAHINREIFAIDPTMYYDDATDEIYMCCSPVIDGVQMLAVQKMKSSTETEGEMAIVTKPELEWELIPPYVGKNAIVEGGYFVKSPNGRIFILYSANGCWSDDYAIGLIEFTGSDMADASAWEKYPEPILVKGNNSFGPGHATFFYSPDKSELWICYHCLAGSNPSVEPEKRFCHAQRVFFDETGFVHIGSPAPLDRPYPVPSEIH